jgi:hypothetical protein
MKTININGKRALFDEIFEPVKLTFWGYRSGTADIVNNFSRVHK